MAKKGQALRPDWFLSNLPTLTKKEDKERIEPDDEEKHLCALSNHAGWKVLREFINNLKTDLEGVNDLAISQGLSFEDIGRNTIVVSQSRKLLEQIIHKVEDAKEAVENPDGTQK